MNWTKSLLIAFTLISVTALSHAQKGIGNKSGISQSNLTYDTKTIAVSVQKIINEPCTKTTGRYSEGTHLLVKETDKNDSEIFNIHLGPTVVVSTMTEKLKEGDKILLKAFSTDELPEGQLIAKEFVIDSETFTLRDDNNRPFWASNRGNKKKRW